MTVSLLMLGASECHSGFGLTVTSSTYRLDSLGLAVRLLILPIEKQPIFRYPWLYQCQHERAGQLRTGEGVLDVPVHSPRQEVWVEGEPNGGALQPEHDMVSGGYAGDSEGRFVPYRPIFVSAREGSLCYLTGAVVSGASPAYNTEEMTYALKTADAKFLMTLPSSMNVAAAAAKNAGIPKERVFLLEGEMDGFTTMKQLLAIGKSYGEQGQVKSFQLPKGKKNKDLCGFLSFSSGTTGLPKAVGSTSWRSNFDIIY